MDARITVDGDLGASGKRSLQDWLTTTPELRGRVVVEQALPPQDRLGPVVDAFLIVLGPGGAAAAAAMALTSWIRSQSGEVTLRIQRGDGTTLEVTASRVRALDTRGLRTHVEQLGSFLDGGGVAASTVKRDGDDQPSRLDDDDQTGR